MTDSDPRSDPLPSAQRARKMREVRSNHATRHRSLRELPAARGIGNCCRGIEGGYETVLDELDARDKPWQLEITKFSSRSVAAAWA